MERASIPVAVAPEEAPWAVYAIRRGGGEPVGLGQRPLGLVWTDAGAVGDLRDVLRDHPEISWVQLPMAGVEQMSQAGSERVCRVLAWEHSAPVLLAAYDRLWPAEDRGPIIVLDRSSA